jgi:hypothetical protein
MDVRQCCICKVNLPRSYPCDRCPTCPGWVFTRAEQKRSPSPNVDLVDRRTDQKEQPRAIGPLGKWMSIIFPDLSIEYESVHHSSSLLAKKQYTGLDLPAETERGRYCDCGTLYLTHIPKRIAHCRFCHVTPNGHPCDPFGPGFHTARRRFECRSTASRADLSPWEHRRKGNPEVERLLGLVQTVENACDAFLYLTRGSRDPDDSTRSVRGWARTIARAIESSDSQSVALDDARRIARSMGSIKSCIRFPERKIRIDPAEVRTLCVLRRAAESAWVRLCQSLLAQRL